MSDDTSPADSLLPYARWTEDALLAVVRSALVHVGEHGLPGEHHFYLTFRTGHPGVSIPGHLKARFPEEMTIVLQHRFWDLAVDPTGAAFSVGLSFGGMASKLTVPFAAITAFADPHVGFGLRFQEKTGETGTAEARVGDAATPTGAPTGAPTGDQAVPAAAEPAEPGAAPAAPAPQVVSLDAFRRRPGRDG